MRVLRIGLAGTLATLSACASGGQGGASSDTAPAAASGIATPALVGTLIGQRPGDVRLSPGTSAGRLRANIQLQSGVAGEELAWRIKSGLCTDNAGAVEVGSAGAYPTLLVRADGTARFNGSVGVPFPGNGAYFVEILRARSSETRLACANLSPEG
jgi:hypothetical protein